MRASVKKDSASGSLYRHFWSTVGSVSVQQENTETTTQPDSQAADDMEVEAVTDHGGWAIKRARDIIKSSTETNLRIKKVKFSLVDNLFFSHHCYV